MLFKCSYALVLGYSDGQLLKCFIQYGKPWGPPSGSTLELIGSTLELPGSRLELLGSRLELVGGKVKITFIKF